MRAYLRLVVVLVLMQLGYYNRRDLFAHWIRKEQPAGRACTHACCRGMRAHPEGYPVAKRARWLRSVGDDEVADYYGRHGGDSERDQAARDQALAEMQRRDQAAERREASEERRRQRWHNRRQFREAERERAFVEAEAATNGYMLNRRGREAGIDPRTLLTGPESRARKYASEELLEHWETHYRPTEDYFQGRDTRIGYGRVYGVQRRVTSEEAAWRERFERVEQEWQEAAA